MPPRSPCIHLVLFLLWIGAPPPALSGQGPGPEPNAAAALSASAFEPPSHPSTLPDPSPPVARVQGDGSRWKLGAGIGLAVGGIGTYLVLRSGDSTAPCDRGANQDAWSTGACLGAAALGGVVGAGVGALVGSRFRTESAAGSLRYTPVLEPRTDGGVRVGVRVLHP